MARRSNARTPFSLFSFQDIITCISGIIILITLVLALELIQRKLAPPVRQTRLVASQIRAAIAEAEAEINRVNTQLAAQTSRAQEIAGFSEDSVRNDLVNTRQQVKVLTADVESLKEQQIAAAKDLEKIQAKRFAKKADEKRLADLESATNDLSQELNQVKQENKAFYNPRTADGRKVWLAQIGEDQVTVAPAGQDVPGVVLSLSNFLFSGSEFSDWLDQRSPQSDFIFLLVQPDGANAFQEGQRLLERKGFSIGFDLLGTDQSAVNVQKDSGEL